MSLLRNLYSDNGGRRAWQVLVDLVVAAWVAAWAVGGHLVRVGMQTMADNGYDAQTRADGAVQRLQAAQDAAGRVPLLGDEIGRPFAATADAVGSLSDTARGFGDWFSTWAWPVSIGFVLVPVVAVVPLWLLLRLRFARRARAARRLASMPGGPRLLALRALATHPVDVLAKVGPDPLSAFEGRQPAAIDQLARLELASCGVRVPGALPALGS